MRVETEELIGFAAVVIAVACLILAAIQVAWWIGTLLGGHA